MTRNSMLDLGAEAALVAAAFFSECRRPEWTFGMDARRVLKLVKTFALCTPRDDVKGWIHHPSVPERGKSFFVLRVATGGVVEYGL